MATVLVRPEDFDRLAKEATATKGPLLPLFDIVPDRFGVVPEGRAIMVQVPAAEVSLLSAPYLRDHVEQSDDRIDAMRYSYEMRLPKPTIIGMDFGIGDYSCSVLSPREIWMATWRWSTQSAQARMQRRLDRSSNVRRRKRAAELQRRKSR